MHGQLHARVHLRRVAKQEQVPKRQELVIARNLLPDEEPLQVAEDQVEVREAPVVVSRELVGKGKAQERLVVAELVRPPQRHARPERALEAGPHPVKRLGKHPNVAREPLGLLVGHHEEVDVGVPRARRRPEAEPRRQRAEVHGHDAYAGKAGAHRAPPVSSNRASSTWVTLSSMRKWAAA